MTGDDLTLPPVDELAASGRAILDHALDARTAASCHDVHRRGGRARVRLTIDAVSHGENVRIRVGRQTIELDDGDLAVMGARIVEG